MAMDVRCEAADGEYFVLNNTGTRAWICKRLRSPGIDTKKSIPTVYVIRQAITTNRVVVLARPGFIGIDSWAP